VPFDSTSQGDADELKSHNLMEAQAEHEILVLDPWINLQHGRSNVREGLAKKEGMR